MRRALLLPLLVSCATAPPPPAEPTVVSEAGVVEIAPGVTVEVAPGWRLDKQDNLLIAHAPEGGLSLATVIERAESGEAAVHAAWARVAPDMKWPEQAVRHPPARDGWDEAVRVEYDVPVAEAYVVLAMGRRAGERWYIQLARGPADLFDRRGAQLATLITSLQAPGRAEERFGPPRPLTEAKLEALAAFVEQARVALDVPGAAIAVVAPDRILMARGFGEKERGRGQAVAPSTLFLIGSTTKSLTTLLQAQLVAKGALTWDTPLQDLLPGFALADPALTRQLTLRHTACACTGMPRRDFQFLLEWQGVTSEARVAEMKTWAPTTGLGETFQYSNHLVAVGGFAAARAVDRTDALGPAYDKAMQAEVLDPLGMTHTTFSFEAAAAADHAMPHGLALEGPPLLLTLADEGGVYAARPAGGAWSSVEDMARYLRLELGKGQLDGAQVVAQDALLARRAPGIKITDKMSYGLGMFVEDLAGVTVLGHGGNNMGFSSDLWFLPDVGVGVVLLFNVQDTSDFRRVVKRRALELIFDAAPKAEGQLEYAVQRTKEARAEAMARLAPVDPELGERLAGRYADPNLGALVLAWNGSLWAEFGEYRSELLMQREGEGVTLVTKAPPLAGLPLVVTEEGGRPAMALDADQTRYLFKAVVPQEATAQPTSTAGGR